MRKLLLVALALATAGFLATAQNASAQSGSWENFSSSNLFASPASARVGIGIPPSSVDPPLPPFAKLA